MSIANIFEMNGLPTWTAFPPQNGGVSGGSWATLPPKNRGVGGGTCGVGWGTGGTCRVGWGTGGTLPPQEGGVGGGEAPDTVSCVRGGVTQLCDLQEGLPEYRGSLSIHVGGKVEDPGEIRFPNPLCIIISSDTDCC